MIKVIYSYIIRNFIKIFFFTTAAFSLVVTISVLFNHINFYMEYKASFYTIMLHLFSNLPEWLIQGLPIATLLALLFSLGNLSKNNEITAIKASGINLWNIITLFMIIGFTIGIGDFSVRELIIPKTSLYNEKIKHEAIKKEDITIQTDFYNKIVPLPNNIRMTIGHLDTKAKTMNNIVMEKYDQNFVLKRLVLAQEAVWENNSWILKNGIMRNFDSDFWNEINFKSYNSHINITPSDMSVQDMRYDTMNVKQFKKYIHQLKIFGQSAIKERIVLNMRFASVFAHIIVMMVGIPFALSPGKRTSRILSFTLALVAALTYWIVQAITKTLGENLVFSPFIAAWLPNIIFLIIGIYLLNKVIK
ncbi:MAG: LptF/LptG family permease [Endomicrobium sp.]|nr:LptF/LptG family permease [Endomicrobium sp.]